MRLLVVGICGASDLNIARYMPDGVSLIITSGCGDAARVAEAYADDNGISKLILRPQYGIYGESAAAKCNEAMLNIADEIIVFWDAKTKGVSYIMSRAEERNIVCNVAVITDAADEYNKF